MTIAPAVRLSPRRRAIALAAVLAGVAMAPVARAADAAAATSSQNTTEVGAVIVTARLPARASASPAAISSPSFPSSRAS